MTKKFFSRCLLLVSLMLIIGLFTGCPEAESLYEPWTAENRGLVAAKVSDGVFISWRLRLADPGFISFNVYRNGTLINEEPLGPDKTNFLDKKGLASSKYRLEVLYSGVRQAFSEEIFTWANNYLRIPLYKPSFRSTNGNAYTGLAYMAGDSAPCDLNGDGIMDIVFFWIPGDQQDSSNSGITGQVYIDAYSLNGNKLWFDKWIELGPNIRAGDHDQIMAVADFNGDGYGEIMVKTAPLTVDTAGKVIGPMDANGNIIYWTRDSNGIIRDSTGLSVDVAPYYYLNAGYQGSTGGGYVLSGEEYLSIFDGRTGALIDTIEFPVQRNQLASSRTGNSAVQGNRTQRFNGGVARLAPNTLSGIFARGYYNQQALTVSAVDFVNNKLEVRWIFSTDPYTTGAPRRAYPVAYERFVFSTVGYTDVNGPYGADSTLSNETISYAGPFPDKAVYGTEGAGEQYRGNGNHQLTVADVTGDGLDEIFLGSTAINSNGTLRWCTLRGHGDAMHVGNHNPWLGDQMVIAVLEGNGNAPYAVRGMQIINARTGETIAYFDAGSDTGRGMTGDIDPDYPGNEAWAASGVGLIGKIDQDYSRLSGAPGAMTFATFWGGGTSRAFLGGVSVDEIVKVRTGVYEARNLITFPGVESNHGTKAVPMLQADLLGDFREEVILREADSSAMRIFTSTIPTIHEGPYAIPVTGIPTLWDNHQYRMQVACQMSAYNQPPWPSWYIGHNMAPIKSQK